MNFGIYENTVYLLLPKCSLVKA